MRTKRANVYDHFREWFRDFAGIDLTPEHRFAAPRRWRFDFAHTPTSVAIELEGGVYAGGRHTRGAGYEKDCEKYNHAAARGWAVFRLTPGMLRADADGCASLIRDAIQQRSKHEH